MVSRRRCYIIYSQGYNGITASTLSTISDFKKRLCWLASTTAWFDCSVLLSICTVYANKTEMVEQFKQNIRYKIKWCVECVMKNVFKSPWQTFIWYCISCITLSTLNQMFSSIWSVLFYLMKIYKQTKSYTFSANILYYWMPKFM